MSILQFAAVTGKAQPNAWVSMGPMLILFGLMFFFMFRSQKKQAQKRQEMLNSITRGTKVITAGGIVGEIVEVKDHTFVVKIADKVNVEINRSGISTIVSSEKEQTK